MLIKKKDLQNALEIVKPGLATKEVIEQTTSFAFINGRVVTFNDEISISHPLEGLEIEGALKAEKLYALLGKIKKEEIDISIVKNEVILTSGRATAGLPLQTEIKLPLEEGKMIGKWKPLPENFIKFMSFAMPSCSKDMSRPVLTCVHVSKEGFIEASDNFRITRCDLKEELPIKDFLIPAASAVDVVKLNPTKIGEAKGWILFKTEEGTIIKCRIFEDEFPDITPFLKAKGNIVILPKTIEAVLDRAMVFSKSEGGHLLDGSVTITLGDNRFKIAAESDSGWFKEEVNIKYELDPVTFSITPYLLKGILSETLACIITKDKIKFEGENWVYITLLRYSK